MKENNNFKGIDEHKAPEDLLKKVKKETEGNIGFLRNIFMIMDIYITNFFGAMLHGIQEEPQEHKTDGKEMAFSSSNPFSENPEEEQLEEGDDEEDKDDDIVI
ncbi:MAG: hypothetical protein ACPG5P_07375 [Saprospiraceae bacterium]